MSDPTQVEAVVSAVERDLGNPSVVIHNAVGGAFGTFREIDPSILNRNFQINTMGRLYLALLPCDGHRRQGRDTCHWQYVGIARHARLRRLRADQSGRSGFWPRRWHALGPQGVHVAYVVIDAVIDLEWTRKRFDGRPDEFFIKLRAIENEIWHVVHQDRSAWSFDVELRPLEKNGSRKATTTPKRKNVRAGQFTKA